MLEIKELNTLNEKELSSLKGLLLEYGHYMYDELQLIAGKDTYWLEMPTFPSDKYTMPNGAFLLALYNHLPAGCVGLRKFNDTSCEMKRLYVKPDYRGLKVGEKLCEEIIKFAQNYKYKKILLDTNKEMKTAVDLYLKCGFKKIPAYCVNQNQHPIYMEKEL